tara:strand:+ start:424 stop:1746 length:1323 start_codon:yes stop_codon:yes gene_type:complete
MRNVTIVGAGYVGLVSGAGISDFGHIVTCVDISKNKIKELKNGKIPIYEPGLDELIKKNVKAGRLFFENNIKDAISNADIIFIAVGTPMNQDGSADITAVKDVAKSIGENLNNYKVICTKSTVPIGTGKLIIDIIKNYKPNDIRFDYVSNPEFLREGSAVKDFLWPDRVVIGAQSQSAFNIMKEVYGPLYINETQIIHTGVVTAEMIKYASNSFLALKISYINEVANLCEAIGADVHEVSNAMGKDGRISPKFLHPGPGFGGSCFPKDTKAFLSFSESYGNKLRTIQAAIETNKNQKQRMVEKIKKLIGGNLKNKKIAILGLAFKPNTNDVRESASIHMIESLNRKRCIINAFDPIANDEMKKIFPNLNYKNSWQEACKGADGVVVMTEWNEFRGISLSLLKSLLKRPILLDTRNIFDIEKLIKHNYKFDNVGRKYLDEN